MPDKLDRIMEDITEIKVTMAENTVSLKDHMRRTENIEKRVEPLEKSQAMWAGINKLIVVLGAIAGLGTALYGLLR